MRELIIDITYKCNSECNYCQWSRSNKVERRIIPLNYLLVTKQTLDNLNVSKVVINGGEPILSTNLGQILEYYFKLGLDLRLISNGIKLDQKTIQELIEKGVNGFVISLDSVVFDLYSKNRNISREKFNKIVNNICYLSNISKKLKIYTGLNVTLTSQNCNLENIIKLLDFAKEQDIAQIKFQPVFDDGYLSKNAPNLELNEIDIPELKRIQKYVQNKNFNSSFTNPPRFWLDIIELISTKKINPSNCDIADNTILLHEGVLKFCFWCRHASYGSVSEPLSTNKIKEIQDQFRKGLDTCSVLPQCFCLQPVNHIWLSKRS